MSANRRFKNKNLRTHPFCHDCMAKYIEVKIQDNNTAKIECPGLNCERFLNSFSCKLMIPSSLFTKWCDLLCEYYLLDFEISYCPNKNCMALVANECHRTGREKKAQCPNRKHWFCFQCKLKWHDGYPWEESAKSWDWKILCSESFKRRRIRLGVLVVVAVSSENKAVVLWTAGLFVSLLLFSFLFNRHKWQEAQIFWYCSSIFHYISLFSNNGEKHGKYISVIQRWKEKFLTSVLISLRETLVDIYYIYNSLVTFCIIILVGVIYGTSYSINRLDMRSSHSSVL